MTFIVAELGCNWHGNIVVLDRMVYRAKLAGCNAVKFQALSKELLARHYEWDDWYYHASITQDNIETIDRVCGTHKIEWFASVCYPDAVGFIDQYVKQWKIRHADRNRMDIIQQCLKTNKPIILSTDRPIDNYKNNKQIHQVYCIPLYPIPDFGDINFDMLKRLKGWSNHYKGLDACLKALKYDIDYLEFHLTDNISEHSVDNRVSLTYSQMDILMYYKRLLER